MNTDLLKRSVCPLSNALDIFGDKWTLLLVRDLFIGKTTYKEFQNSPEAMPTNILAERLKRLEHYKVIDKTPYQSNPIRFNYNLTQKGQDLRPVIMSMLQWGEKHIVGSKSLLV